MWRVAKTACKYLAAFLVGVGLTAVIVNYSVITGATAGAEAKLGPELNISYADFITILLTAVTVVLTALAITIGVVAAYTISEIKQDARRAVEAEVAEEMKGLRTRIEQVVTRITYQTNGGTDELEGDFDPTDQVIR